MDIPESTEVHSCGTLNYYEKTYDRITPKSERPLERIEGRAFYKVSTSDDPVIARQGLPPESLALTVFILG